MLGSVTVPSRRGAVVFETPPVGPNPTTPSGYAGFVGEWRTLLLPLRLAGSGRALARVPRGDGALVVDVPGWRAPEASMAPLRLYLRRLGHDARGWGLGINEGDPERDSEILAGRVSTLRATTGRTVALVGWSLGGLIAREVARLVPDAVHQVVTYGTPVVGGPTYTLGARTYGAAECERILALQQELDRTDPIRVPVTAIFTRRDAVVSWSACIDRVSPDVRHIEVGSTHFGMGLDPQVWETVARALARRG